MKAFEKMVVAILLAGSILLVNAAHATNWMAIGVHPDSVGSDLKGQTVYVDLDRIDRNGSYTSFRMKSKLNPGLIPFPEMTTQMVVDCSNRTFANPPPKVFGIKADGEQVLIKEIPAEEWKFSTVFKTSIIDNHWEKFCPSQVASLKPAVSTAGSAQNWVGIGVSSVTGETKGQIIYLDMNAIERTGAFASIWLKAELLPSNTNNMVATIEQHIIDCDNRTFARTKVFYVKASGERLSVRNIVPKAEDFAKLETGSPALNNWNLICPAKVSSTPTPAPPKTDDKSKPAFSISTGSGFFVTEDGYFVTNYHVVEGAESVVLLDVNLKSHDAKLVRVDKANDIAILKVKGKFKAIPVISSRSAKRGQDVVTVGYPHAGIQGVEPKVTGGIINSLSGIRNDARTFQISVPLQSGNSGGPLVTMEGNVIGVVAMKLSALTMLKETGDLPQNVNYAIKSNYLSEVLLGIPGVERKLLHPGSRRYKDVAELASAIEAATALVLAESGEEKK